MSSLRAADFWILFTFHLAVAGLVKVFDLKHRALVVVGIGHPIKGLEVVQVPLELHLHRGLTWSLSVCVLLVEDLRRPSK